MIVRPSPLIHGKFISYNRCAFHYKANVLQ